MPSRITSRFADQSDILDILELLWEMHEESGLGSLNVGKVIQKTQDTLNNGLIIIAKQDDKIIGTIGLNKFQFWWSDDWAIGDQWSFVTKEKRKSKAFFSMIKMAKDIAGKANIPLLLANFGTVDEERKTKMFSKIGVKMGVTIMAGDTSRFLWRK